MSKKRKRTLIMGLPNPDAVRRDQERRRSGAAGRHKSSKWDESRSKIKQELRGIRCNICTPE